MVNVTDVKHVCKMCIFTWYVVWYISNFPTVNILIWKKCIREAEDQNGELYH